MTCMSDRVRVIYGREKATLLQQVDSALDVICHPFDLDKTSFIVQNKNETNSNGSRQSIVDVLFINKLKLIRIYMIAESEKVMNGHLEPLRAGTGCSKLHAATPVSFSRGNYTPCAGALA